MRSVIGCAFVIAALAGPAGAQDRVDVLMERLERQEREIQYLP